MFGLAESSGTYTYPAPIKQTMMILVDIAFKLGYLVNEINIPDKYLRFSVPNGSVSYGETILIHCTEISGGTSFSIESKCTKNAAYGKHGPTTQRYDWGKNKKNIETIAQSFQSFPISNYTNVDTIIADRIQKCPEHNKLISKKSNSGCFICLAIAIVSICIAFIIDNTCQMTYEETYTYWFFGDHEDTRLVHTGAFYWSIILKYVVPLFAWIVGVSVSPSTLDDSFTYKL